MDTNIYQYKTVIERCDNCKKYIEIIFKTCKSCGNNEGLVDDNGKILCNKCTRRERGSYVSESSEDTESESSCEDTESDTSEVKSDGDIENLSTDSDKSEDTESEIGEAEYTYIQNKINELSLKKE